MPFETFIKSTDPNREKEDFLHIKPHHISSSLNALKFKDSETGQIVYFFPSLEISGYGENEEKVFEMGKFSLEQCF